MLPRGLNSSFIALIPKVDTPKVAGDYRPISLNNFTMKILLKVLANRLSPALRFIVSEHQSAFVKKKYISDSILVANELAHSILKGNCTCIILKNNIPKAFDSVNWVFLKDTMRCMIFSPTWIGWIRSILSSANPSLLFNGSPTKEF